MPYTNELLEQKWKAQRELARMAEDRGMSYFEFVHQYGRELQKERGAEPKIAQGLEVAEVNKDALEELLGR